MQPFRLEPVYDTLKLMVIFACIAGGYVLVAGGGFVRRCRSADPLDCRGTLSEDIAGS